MYRQYENPYKLEEQLKQRKVEYQMALAENADEDILINIAEDISDLEERVNFAWQDDEYDD